MNPARQARIEAELAVLDPSDVVPAEPKPLTEVERSTLLAMAEHGPNHDSLAAILCVHPNTLKYRIECIRRKYGMPRRNAPGLTWRVLYEALRRGDAVIGGQPAEVLDDFLGYVLAELPAGALTPLSVGLATWLRDQAAKYLRERGAA